VNLPVDAIGFRGMIPQINQAINTTPGYGMPGFPGNIYSDRRADEVNRL
jgi:hypothetical protein